jgi:hypothetical protein
VPKPISYDAEEVVRLIPIGNNHGVLQKPGRRAALGRNFVARKIARCNLGGVCWSTLRVTPLVEKAEPQI